MAEVTVGQVAGIIAFILIIGEYHSFIERPEPTCTKTSLLTLPLSPDYHPAGTGASLGRIYARF